MHSRFLATLTLALLCVCSPVLAQDRLNLERAWSVDDEWENPIISRLSLHSAQPGRLVLLDQQKQALRQEQGSPVWLVYLWQMESEEEMSDRLFYTNFTPEAGGGPAFQRILRVAPGSDVRFTLIQEQGQWLWRSMAESPQEIQLLPSETNVQVDHPTWMSAEAVDDDLKAFWKQVSDAGIEEPAFVDVAADLQIQGFRLIGEGLYAEALLILKHSYDIEPMPELLDRIRRLERYVDLQAQ